MKFWFYDFLDEIADGLSKVWIKYKQKKNADYKESPNLKKYIRLGLGLLLGFLFITVIVSFGLETVKYLK